MDARRLIFAAGPVVAAAGFGSLGARRAPETYHRLDKPRWAPPARAFGPVWSGLYIGIGVAGWRLFGSASRRARPLHLAQLALNAAWPITFFGVRDKRASLVIIALLDGAVTGELLMLRHKDPVAALLLMPYLAWSGFATVPNAAVSDPGDRG
jgi:tryptophan-rich sensory protein